MDTDKIIKPIIKWVGGKTQIISTILSKFPKTMRNYHEPFLGGGSVLLAVLSSPQVEIKGTVYAYDLNSALISMYTNIQKNPKELYNLVNHLKEEYQTCETEKGSRTPNTEEESKSSRESYYYWKRKVYNELVDKSTLEASALFIFLNKTCFRGMFREGPNGFNVPFGHYKNINIVDLEHLMAVSKLIKDVVFRTMDFVDAFKHFKRGDFVYLDPPYAPEVKTSFVGYNKDGFGIDKHKELFDLTKTLKQFVMSNSKTELVLSYFLEDEFVVEDIECKRSINSKKPGSTTTEVIISKI